jgi:hypothetical protein
VGYPQKPPKRFDSVSEEPDTELITRRLCTVAVVIKKIVFVNATKERLQGREELKKE